MSEKKFEECLLQDATHVEVNGVRHELNDNVLYFRNGDLLGMSWRGEYTYISEELFSTLGIKPLFEIKPEPIEFEAVFAKYDSKWHPLYGLNDELAYQNSMKARFKCVEILEEKK